jgi:vacuolar-type H+-ATPase subunit H
MTDQPGLSIFDKQQQSGPSRFPIVRRSGYDREAVDQFLASEDNARSEARSALRAAQQKIKEGEAQIAGLQRRLNENAKPSYAGLGGRAAEMLRLAEEQAEEVATAAEEEAAKILTAAKAEASRMRSDAHAEAEDIKVVQLQEVEQRRQTYTAEAEQLRAQANAQSADVLPPGVKPNRSGWPHTRRQTICSPRQGGTRRRSGPPWTERYPKPDARWQWIASDSPRKPPKPMNGPPPILPGW